MGGELIEIEKNAGYQAVLTYLQDYTQKIREIQEKYALSVKDVMSTKLIDNYQLSSEERVQLSNLKLKIDHIINEVAQRVEKHRIHSYDDYTRRYELNAYDRLRVDSLVSSVRNINVSIQKLKVAVENFTRCNRFIIGELDECLQKGDFSRGKMFVLGNMLLIYELANYMINFLEKFKLEGVDDILALSEKEINNINITRQNLEKLKQDLDSPDIDDKVKEQIAANLRDREKSLDAINEEWDKYTAGIREVQGKVGSLQSKLPTLRLIRANAQNQLDFFEIMKIFGIVMVTEAVKKNLETLEVVTLPLDELKLISLPPHRVQQLLGFSSEEETSQTG